MGFSRFARIAKHIVDQRGGVDALKADADKLKNIAKSEGSLGTKAGAAVKAIKDGGAKDPEPPTGAAGEGAQPAAETAPPAAETAPPAAETPPPAGSA